MATSSTRSARKLAHGAAATYDPAPPPTPALAGRTAVGREMSERTWLIAYFAVLAAALLLRVAWLELRPMHHDEGVNGHFLLGLMRNGVFRYDPSNYHGPTLYYFTLPLAYAAEAAGRLSTWVVRLVPVVFGMGTVWLGLSLRRYVGAVGALAAGALMAVSPGLVFFSRYFIHEMLFVFFTLGLVVAALRFYETGGRTRENGGGAGVTAQGWGAVRQGGGAAAAGALGGGAGRLG
ncbi:MAG: glycosyltransferase family 39 protein, partial [Acidobacteria bacterium]|nr:glycosyltransferase family 39 protein [Acidobacteriota bacterium]